MEIGNPDLIDKRTHRIVPAPPGGTLSDYVPFYFTLYSPMLYNIKTGMEGHRAKADVGDRDSGVIASGTGRARCPVSLHRSSRLVAERDLLGRTRGRSSARFALVEMVHNANAGLTVMSRPGWYV